MNTSHLKKLGGGIAATILALALIGCKGADGKNGANGINGTPGTNGTSGTNGTNATLTVNAAALTNDQWAQLSFQGNVTSVTMGAAPIVNFKVTDAFGTPVSGLGFTSKSATALRAKYSNFAFTIAKLVPGDAVTHAPSKWVSYLIASDPTTTTPALPRASSWEQIGTLVDHADGTYTYTFYQDITKSQAFLDAATYTGNNVKADLGDVSYQPDLTHRIGIMVGGNSPDGTVAVKDATNIIYDFIPTTSLPVAVTDTQREEVDLAACKSCHTKVDFHGGKMVDTRFCVTCHTDQRRFGKTEATTDGAGTFTSPTSIVNGQVIANFPVMIHKIHMGEDLTLQNYSWDGLAFNLHTYPQDPRNCVKCHSTTPQSDAWKTNPSRLACGACHDKVNFATGINHLGGAQADDKNCVGCHAPAGIVINHTPVAPSDPAFATGGYTNGSSLAAYTNNLPAGAIKVTYDLKSVTLDATGHPIFSFRFLQDGARADFNTFGVGVTELWNGYVGSPSAYLTFAVPQDGIATPADKNVSASAYIKKVWNGTATGTSGGTLTGPDSSGYYTLTMTGVAIPANATMITGGLGYTYNKNSQPLTQIALANYPYDSVTMLGGLSVPAPNVFMTVSGPLPAGFAPQSARRTIVDSNKCNACHVALGVFATHAYHAGERNNAESCNFCHRPNQTSSGWSANASTFIHGIHAGAGDIAAPGHRTVPFTWHATSATDNFSSVTYPAILNNCEACHVPGSYDFSNSTNAAAIPNMLVSTVGQGKYDGASATAYTLSPYVVKDNVTNYGTGFSYNIATGVTTAAASTTLVNTPITAACASCHDSGPAIAHMTGNGGAFYEARATALTKVEQCLVCHGNGRTADIKTVHMTFK